MKILPITTKEEIIKVEKAFDASVIKSAKTIHQKYISPPAYNKFCNYVRTY